MNQKLFIFLVLAVLYFSLYLTSCTQKVLTPQLPRKGADSTKITYYFKPLQREKKN